MTLVPSLDNFSKGPYTISTMASLASYQRKFTNYVSIIIKRRFKDHLIYNGSSLYVVATYMVPDLQNYVVVIAELNPLATVHIITNSYQSATFGLMVYGISFYVQFGYVGGMSFNGTACGRSPTVTIPATVTTTTLSKTTKAVKTNGKGSPTMTIPATVTTTTLSKTQKAVTTNGKGPPIMTIPATVTTTTISNTTKAVTTNGKGPPTMTIPATVTPTTISNTTKAVATNGKGPRCYSCTHIPHLRYCDTLQQCREGQVCFVERNQSLSGTPYYTAGCTQEQSCQFNQLSKTTTNDQCFSCCRSNFCNNEGCGDQSFSSPRTSGPLCFDCQNFDDRTTCDRVTLCSASEVCSIEERRWGTTDKIYKMGCTPKYTCSSISDHFRRSLPVCSSCCDKDYCNINCTSALGAGTIFG